MKNSKTTQKTNEKSVRSESFLVNLKTMNFKSKQEQLYDSEGQFTYWKSVRDFFRTKGFIRIFDGFFLKTKGFLPKVYEIFWSEMPLV